MSILTSETYAPGVVADTLEMTSKQLRRLIYEIGMEFDADEARKSRQWRRFSLLDILRLAIVRVLMGYGVEARDAVKAAHYVIDSKMGADGSREREAREFLMGKNAPRELLRAKFNVEVLVMERHGETWETRIDWLRDFVPPPAGIIVCIGTVAQYVLDRLKEIENE